MLQLGSAHLDSAKLSIKPDLGSILTLKLKRSPFCSNTIEFFLSTTVRLFHRKCQFETWRKWNFLPRNLQISKAVYNIWNKNMVRNSLEYFWSLKSGALTPASLSTIMIAGLLSGFTMYRCGWVFFYHKCVGNSSIHSSGHNDNNNH